MFIIENNNYSVYTPIKPRQSNVLIEDKIKGFNVKYLGVKRHNFRELNNHFLEAKEFMNDNNEPVVIEVDTHRYLEHCGPNKDDDLDYRPKELIDFWEKLDILDIYKTELFNKGFKNDNFLAIEDEVNQSINKKFQKSEEKHLNERKLGV